MKYEFIAAMKGCLTPPLDLLLQCKTHFSLHAMVLALLLLNSPVRNDDALLKTV